MPLPSDKQLADRTAKWGVQPRSSSPGDIDRETVTAGRGRDKGKQKSPGHGRSSGSGGHGRSRTPTGFDVYQRNNPGHGRNASPAAHTPSPAADGSLDTFDFGSFGKAPDPDVEVTISVVQGWALYIQINIFKCLRAAGCFKIFLLWVPCVSDAS